MNLIPFNRLETSDDILFATRGGTIHSFNLSNGKHVSSWQHPDVAKFAPPAQNEPDLALKPDVQVETQADAVDLERPAKRAKIADEEAESTAAAAADADSPLPKDQNGNKKGKKQSKGSQNHGDRSRMGRTVDRPLVTLMACTQDGKHLVAVSGHDKAVWVFEHDGQGNLTQLSQRVMPKRPSAIAIGFEQDIIVADKFGDVYSLPLFMTPLSPATLALRAAPAAALKKQSSTRNEPAANTLTVHSKRNRIALEAQRKQLQAGGNPEPKSEGPSFDLSLLLGHVSMLTSLALAARQPSSSQQGRKRRYILTADRDEHIRVSRYKPQAHIIEGFCLGHKEFVSEILVPRRREDVLISGGGDDYLFLWDWEAGKLLSKTDLVALSREIAPQTSQVSVSCLTSLVYPSDEGPLTYILATCEDLKAIFAWQLTEENELKNPSIIQLPCHPLHISAISPDKDDAPVKIIVAMDTSLSPEIRSLHSYTLTRSEGRLSSDIELPLHGQSPEENEPRASPEEIRDMFYSVNKLRKQNGPGDDPEPDAAAKETGEQADEDVTNDQ